MRSGKNRRKLENVAIENALHLEAARATQPFAALIMTPCQVWSRWTYPLLYYSVSAAVTLLYPATLTFDLWPLDLELLQNFGCHAFKLCTKFEWNRIIFRWVIDDLARFRCAILGVGARLTNSSQGCVDPTSLNMVRTVRAFISTQEVNFSVQISCCIFKREWLKVEWCENDAKFRTFDPSVKNRRGVGEISIPIVEALPTIHWNTSKYIWRQSNAWLLRAVDTKKERKESSWVGRPNYGKCKKHGILTCECEKDLRYLYQWKTDG